MKAVSPFESSKIPPEAFAAVVKARRGGNPRARSDDDRFRRSQLMRQPGDGIPAGFGRDVRRILGTH